MASRKTDRLNASIVYEVRSENGTRIGAYGSRKEAEKHQPAGGVIIEYDTQGEY